MSQNVSIGERVGSMGVVIGCNARDDEEGSKDAQSRYRRS